MKNNLTSSGQEYFDKINYHYKTNRKDKKESKRRIFLLGVSVGAVIGAVIVHFGIIIALWLTS